MCGTRIGYDLGCRCGDCRAAKSACDRRYYRAKKSGRRQPHPWREQVLSEYRLAVADWEARREAVALGYRTEEAEFQEDNPRPLFRDYLRGMRAVA